MAAPERNPVASKPLLEISLDSAESALAAERGGAARVELCANLLEGGTTPSAGMIATVRKEIRIGLHVMIRPRGGDFCYSAQEFEVMKRDVLMAKQLCVDSVVLGVLNPDGTIDTRRSKELADLARPAAVTFHRAFDMTVNLRQAVEAVVESGARRILTSGGATTAEGALGVIRQLVQAAKNRVVIVACGGVREHNVRHIIDETGVREVHVGHTGVEMAVASPMEHRNEKLSMGSMEGREYERFVVSQEHVRSLVRALD